MKKLFVILPFLFATFYFAGCSGSGYKETESGLIYKFHKSNRGAKPSIDNIVKIDFAYSYPEDSLFFESKDAGTSAYMRIQPSGYPGDIYEALRLMSKGDSATFKLNANKFFTISAGSPTVPDFIDPNDYLYVHIVMHDFFNDEEYEAYQRKEREELMKQQEDAALNESRMIDQYLAQNNITTEPEESGLIIIIKEKGNGPVPSSGQRVTVHYTGTLLDGTPFDSSVERGRPFEFNLGRGEVIRGWDEGISKLPVGSKARLIIPSYLGYGDRDRSEVIRAFSTLVFDIELLDAN